MIEITFYDFVGMQEINTFTSWPVVPRLNEYVVIHDKDGLAYTGNVREVWWRTGGVNIVIGRVRPEIKEPSS